MKLKAMMSSKTNIGVSKEYTVHFRMSCKEDRGEEGLEAHILSILKVLWKRCGWKVWVEGVEGVENKEEK